VYHDGKSNLRDEPEFDENDTGPIPVKDQIVRRKGADYRVTSVTKIESPEKRIPGLATYLVNVTPIDEYRSDSTE
jgi:hypothetical protein